MEVLSSKGNAPTVKGVWALQAQIMSQSATAAHTQPGATPGREDMSARLAVVWQCVNAPSSNINSCSWLLLACDVPISCACVWQDLAIHLPLWEEMQAQIVEGRRHWEVGFINRQLQRSA